MSGLHQYQTWGCPCPACLLRDHPMDRIARFTAAQLGEWAAARLRLDDMRSKRAGLCVACDAPGELYAGGRYCNAHAPGSVNRAA